MAERSGCQTLGRRDSATTVARHIRSCGDLPDAQRSDGLGSHILTASTTSWTLEHDEHGTTLRATLPVR